MDLKDVILSTLAELENSGDEGTQKPVPARDTPPQPSKEPIRPLKEEPKSPPAPMHDSNPYAESSIPDAMPTQMMAPEPPQTASHRMEESMSHGELQLLTSLRERILVLFEGMQSPNNTNLESKVDMILNFLEYELAVIDERIEKLSRR